MKRCRDCQQWKCLDAFPPNKSRPDGRRGLCRSCWEKRYGYAALTDEQRAAHKAARRVRHRRHPDKIRAQWKRDHERNKEAYQRRSREWKRANSELNRAQKQRYNARRRALMAGRSMLMEERFTRRDIYVRDGGHCHMCGRPVPFEDFQVDHVLPLARGGQHTRENVAVSCAHCNNSRGARTVEEYKEWLATS